MHGYVKQKKKVSKTTVAVFIGKSQNKSSFHTEIFAKINL